MSPEDNYDQQLTRAGVYFINTWEGVLPHGGQSKSNQMSF